MIHYSKDETFTAGEPALRDTFLHYDYDDSTNLAAISKLLEVDIDNISAEARKELRWIPGLITLLNRKTRNTLRINSRYKHWKEVAMTTVIIVAIDIAGLDGNPVEIIPIDRIDYPCKRVSLEINTKTKTQETTSNILHSKHAVSVEGRARLEASYPDRKPPKLQQIKISSPIE